MKAFLRELGLAWRNVRRNRRRSLVTMFIAGLGTAAVLIAGGYTLYTYDGLREGAAREMGHITLGHKDAFTKDEDTPMQYGLADYPRLVAELEKDPRVHRVLPRVSLSGLVSNGDKSMIFMGTGADVQAEAAARGDFLTLTSGRLMDSSGSVVRAMLGTDLAKSLNTKVGGGLTLLATTSGGAMNAVDVVVAGTVSTGWRDLDKRLVYVDVATAQRLMVTDKVSSLAVFLKKTGDTPAVLADLQAKYPALAIKPWWEQAFYYFAVRDIYNRIFGLLGGIIGVLVFFSVANTLGMAVVERTREIGTLRALGALPGEVVAQFVREGALIGGVGSAAGMLVAAGVALSLRWAGIQMPPPPGRSIGYPLQVYVSLPLYAGTACAIVLLCAAAAWFVSRKAVRKPIVEALGHV